MTKFDSEYEKPFRTIIQDKVIEILGQLTRAEGGYLRDVVPFGSVVRSWTDEIGIDLLMRSLPQRPGIAVATASCRFSAMNTKRSDFSSDLELMLYFANDHARGMQMGRQAQDRASRSDPRIDPGLHVALTHARELLMGQFPHGEGGRIKQLIPDMESELCTLPEVTIWTQTYSVKLFDLRPPGGGGSHWRNAKQLLQSIHWRVTTSESEAPPPAAPIDSTSIDTQT